MNFKVICKNSKLYSLGLWINFFISANFFNVAVTLFLINYFSEKLQVYGREKFPQIPSYTHTAFPIINISH